MNDSLTERLAAAAEALRTASRVALVGHDAPDGDAIGSCLALGHMLARMGVRFQVLCRDPVPSLYRFLPGADAFVQQSTGDFDCVVFVDCADRKRASVSVSAPVTINVDHHPTNDGWGDLAVVDPRAAAVGELVVYLSDQVPVPIDPAMALCLYVAIVTDTGSFQYANTTADTFSLASRLTEAGADPAMVADRVYGTRSVSHVRLLGLALATLELSDDGLLAWMSLNRENLGTVGAADEDVDGVINFARLANGVMIGVLFREIEEGAVRVGFRGRRGVDVSMIAVEFGGGGHPGAAGCTVSGTLDEVRERVLCACRNVLSLGERQT